MRVLLANISPACACERVRERGEGEAEREEKQLGRFSRALNPLLVLELSALMPTYSTQPPALQPPVRRLRQVRGKDTYVLLQPSKHTREEWCEDGGERARAGIQAVVTRSSSAA